jgi:hypothetical protein
MSTHPPSAERVKQMKKLSAIQKGVRNAKVSGNNFKKAQAIVRKLMKV